jgi:hypothetical protein
LLREPALDLVRAQDVGLSQTPDPLVLEWAARESRVLISEDRRTMIGFAWARVSAGQAMPGLFAIRPQTTIGKAIDDILIAATCYSEEDMRNLAVLFIPL